CHTHRATRPNQVPRYTRDDPDGRTANRDPQTANRDPRSAARSPGLPPPLLLLLVRKVGGGDVHLAADVADAPAGQAGQVRRFPLLALAHGSAVRHGRFAFRVAIPGVAEDVAGLEVFAVARGLEDEVL